MRYREEQDFRQVEPPAVMRMPEVMQTVGLSRASIYRLMQMGEFPLKFKIGSSAVGWMRTEIERWVMDRAASREPFPQPAVLAA